MRICDLKQKEVINSCDCKRLGYVEDVVFDLCSGKVEAIVVPGPGRFYNLICSDIEYVIPIKCIVQSGDDIIIVQVNVEEVRHKIT